MFIYRNNYFHPILKTCVTRHKKVAPTLAENSTKPATTLATVSSDLKKVPEELTPAGRYIVVRGDDDPCLESTTVFRCNIGAI